MDERERRRNLPCMSLFSLSSLSFSFSFACAILNRRRSRQKRADCICSKSADEKRKAERMENDTNPLNARLSFLLRNSLPALPPRLRSDVHRPRGTQEVHQGRRRHRRLQLCVAAKRRPLSPPCLSSSDAPRLCSFPGAAIAEYEPLDATTNPSLVYAASQVCPARERRDERGDRARRAT